MKSLKTSYVKKLFFLIAVFFIAVILMYLRRPDIIRTPQFWAEDGHVWYAMAYNNGIFTSMIFTQNGYYQTISKLIASISLNFNLMYAPLIFNISAIIVRALLVSFILSGRFSYVNITPRIFTALFIIIMPEVSEVHANVTNDHWYLSLYLLLVMLAPKPTNNYQKAHDYIAIIICGLSGPFIVFMAPMVGINILIQKRLSTKKITTHEYVFIAICFIQFISIIMTSSETRVDMALGANFATLCKILTTKVFLGLWANGDFLSPLWNHDSICIAITMICLSITIFTFIVSNYPMRSAIVFAILTLTFSLAKPMLSSTSEQWPLLIHGGGRYSVIPTIIWYSVLVYFLNYISHLHFKFLPWMLYTTSLISCLYFFNLTPLPDYGWKEQVKKFESLAPGESYSFKFNPAGWTMTLIKKQP